MSIRIAIADDQDLIRESLKIVLDINEDMEVAVLARNGVELLKMLDQQPVDVILMDVRMPEMDGVMATKAVKAKYPATRIIILTTFDDDEYVFNGLKYGASGYLLKGISVPDLSEAIRKVVAGEAMLNKDIVTKVVKLFSQSNALAAVEQPEESAAEERAERARSFEIAVDGIGVKELVRTERNVIRLVGRGMSNKEIAKELCLSEGTVRNCMSVILSKLAIRDRTQLAIWSVQTGMAGQLLEG